MVSRLSRMFRSRLSDVLRKGKTGCFTTFFDDFRKLFSLISCTFPWALLEVGGLFPNFAVRNEGKGRPKTDLFLVSVSALGFDFVSWSTSRT